jgi:hypothetical protein
MQPVDLTKVNAAISRELAEKTNEVARLRELLNRAIDYTKNALFFARTYDNKIQWNEIDKLWDEIRDLEKEALAPEPEEPVTQDESSDAVRYADHILNHYDRNSEKDKLCLAKDLLRHGWNNGQANALAPEEPTIKESLKAEPEWRELGPDEVIVADDEYNPASLSEWIKVPHGWIGEKCDITKIRTLRPLPKQEEMPLEGDIASIEWSCAHTARAIRYLRDEIQNLYKQQDDINRIVGGQIQKLSDELKMQKDMRWKIQVTTEVNKLRDEIQKLKEGK